MSSVVYLTKCAKATQLSQMNKFILMKNIDKLVGREIAVVQLTDPVGSLG